MTLWRPNDIQNDVIVSKMMSQHSVNKLQQLKTRPTHHKTAKGYLLFPENDVLPEVLNEPAIKLT